MQPILIRILLLTQALIFLWACTSSVEQTQPTAAAQKQSTAAATSQATAAKPATPKTVAQTSGPTFSHRSPRDSVDWASLNPSGTRPKVSETDLEWPGETLGLSGPIVATGGKGAKQFIVVFDSAGIPVGALTRKAYKEDPGQLSELLARAQVRSELQNLATLVYLMDQQKAQAMSTSATP